MTCVLKVIVMCTCVLLTPTPPHGNIMKLWSDKIPVIRDYFSQ